MYLINVHLIGIETHLKLYCSAKLSRSIAYFTCEEVVHLTLLSSVYIYSPTRSRVKLENFIKKKSSNFEARHCVCKDQQRITWNEFIEHILLVKPDSSTSPHQQDPSEMSDQTSESSETEGEEQEENTQVTATLPFTRVSQLAHFPIDFKNQFKKSKPGSSKGTKKGVKRKRGSGKTKKKRRKKWCVCYWYYILQLKLAIAHSAASLKLK